MRGIGRPALAALAVALLLISTASAARPTLPAGIPPAERARLEGVAAAASVTTLYTLEPFVTRRDAFEYLVSHPELATQVTRSLKLARYKIWHTDEGLFLDDGWGSHGRFWIVHEAPGTRVVYMRGEYSPPLLPVIRGEAIATIDYRFTGGTPGREIVTMTAGGFVKLDSRIAKMAITVAGRIAQDKADLEARRFIKVIARASRIIVDDPKVVIQKLSDLPGVSPHELAEFRALLLGHPS